jgi:1-acyl-sn-glycerol-3-phosphate acyltransferase
VAAGVPIIPVGVLGTEKVQPIGQPYPMPFRGKIILKFGKPIETHERADDRHSLRVLTDEVMAEIQKLTGQEYVPRYAPAKPTS